ncbi:MAG TPA: amino acid ABC transporter substrate-binding protein, partial [Acidothermaceae bacterium]|nr:amino acid ABC transporter substrate-binding protein [Acidothermaceae bacterium]
TSAPSTASASAPVATSASAASASAPVASPTGSPITIGISLSLTGDFSDPGTAAQKGYQTWASVVNAKGGINGHPVVLKIVDDTSSPDQVTTNYQTLISKDKVNFVFGPFSSLLTVPAGQVANRYGYAFIEPAGGGPAVFAEHLPNLFFVQPAPTISEGKAFASYVLSLPAAQRPKTAAYPELDDPFSGPISETVRTQFEAAGIKTVYKQVYPPELTDLTSIVQKMKTTNADVVVAGTQSDDAFAMVKAMVQLKFAPKMLFFANGANDPLNFPDKVGAANVNGIFSASDWFPDATTFRSSEFVQAYLAKFGGTAQQIDPTSAEAYSCGVLLEEAIAKTGGTDNKAIIAALHQGTWPTPEGNLSWDADGAPQGSDTLVQWQGGKLLAVWPQSAAKVPPILAPLPWAS